MNIWITQRINSELEKADIYIRCVDRHLQHLRVAVTEMERIMKMEEDYLEYETEEASRSKFNSPANRIVLILDPESVGFRFDNKGATVIGFSSSQNPLLVAEE